VAPAGRNDRGSGGPQRVAPAGFAAMQSAIARLAGPVTARDPDQLNGNTVKKRWLGMLLLFKIYISKKSEIYFKRIASRSGIKWNGGRERQPPLPPIFIRHSGVTK
jgi:hypothetical protein